jgi:hypothetical protein
MRPSCDVALSSASIACSCMQSERVAVVERALAALAQTTDVSGGDFLARRFKNEALPLLAALLQEGPTHKRWQHRPSRKPSPHSQPVPADLAPSTRWSSRALSRDARHLLVKRACSCCKEDRLAGRQAGGKRFACATAGARRSGERKEDRQTDRQAGGKRFACATAGARRSGERKEERQAGRRQALCLRHGRGPAVGRDEARLSAAALQRVRCAVLRCIAAIASSASGRSAAGPAARELALAAAARLGDAGAPAVKQAASQV